MPTLFASASQPLQMQTVPSRVNTVNRLLRQLVLLGGVMVSFAGFSVAHAEDARTRAIQNSQQINNALYGTVPELRHRIIQGLEKGTFSRVAPELPIWILDTQTDLIIYYQGQPAFKNQPASRLVDDKGIRFGVQALARAKADRNGWLNITLGNQVYKAYCHAITPHVVCSLVP